MNRRGVIALLLSALVFTALWVMFSIGLTVHVRSQTSATNSRLAAAARGLLEKARRSNDDITVQNTVQAFSQVPGVTLVCVTDTTGRILADPEPALMGQNFALAHHSMTAVSYALHSASTSWGILWLGFCDRPARVKARRAKQAAAALIGSGWLAILVLLMMQRRALLRLQQDAANTLALQQDTARKLQRLQREGEERKKIADGWMASLIEVLPSPAVFLDDRQRVVAVNRRMLQAWHASQPAEWLGRSWQDIPGLQSCGPALEKSLQEPGRPVEVAEPYPKGRLVLKTPQDAGGTVLGTWVTIVES